MAGSATVGHGQTSSKPQDSMQDELPQFLRDLAKAEQKHKERVAFYKDCDDIYDGRLKPARHLSVREGNEWRSLLHPAYAKSIIQTELAMLLDDKAIATVKPPPGKPERKPQADAYENKLNEQRRDDNYDRKWSDNVLQGLKRGVSCVKTAWTTETSMVREQVLTPVYGQLLPDRTISEPEEQTVVDRPTITVCDMNDVMWDPAAVSPDTITTLFYRTYETKASLREYERQGVYENTADVTTGGPSNQDRPGARDTKDLVEIWERWQRRPDGIWLTVVANRGVVLRDEASPFIHQQMPFSFVAPQPRSFRIDGDSDAALVADQQVARWRIQNQMVDNIELINNVVTFAQEDEQDIDAWEISPGAINLTSKPPGDSIYHWNPPTNILAPAQAMLAELQADMEDVTGVSSYLSGAESNAVDPKTATEVQAISSSGQRRILMKKQRFAEQDREIGRMQLQLIEQLAPGVIPAYSSDGSNMPLRIQDIIGCCYEVEDADESLNRQERRAEAALQLQTVGALAVIPQVVSAVNWHALLEDFFEAYDIDPESVLLDAPPPIPQGAPMPGAGLASTPPGGGAPLAAVPTTPQFGAGAASPFPAPGGYAA